jgi:hypothetical protein
VTVKDGFGDTGGVGNVAFKGVREGDPTVAVLTERRRY